MKDERSYRGTASEEAQASSTQGEDRGDQGGSDQDASDKAQSKNKKPPRLLVVAIILGFVAVLVIGGLLWWAHARQFEATDDAYIDTHITHVAPQVSGQVTQVFVQDNTPVHAGQLLAQLDVATARTQLAQAQASEQQALTQIAQAQAQVVVNQAQVEQAQANTRGPAAQAAFARRDFRRYADVQGATPEAVARQQVDQARTTAINNAAQLTAAEKQVKTNRAQLAAARTQIEAGRAQVQSARAQEAAAQLSINYGRIVSPVDGHVANKQVAVGNYATAGQELLSVVPDAVWITANFKETQLQRVRIGQPVDVKIDAYPQVRFPAHIDSIQRGAGQSFAVLPAQNATGNFVKVVQRVPVRIIFDRPREINRPLGPGMSVTPRVRVG